MLYRNDIQGLRAIAILLVIAAHFGIPGFSWGFVGVDIFFVISGYLITGLIYQEQKITNQFSYINFYARRIRRLLPGMFLMIGVVLFTCYFLLAPQEQMKLGEATPFAISWLSNFHFILMKLNYFDAPLQDSLLLHTWSLAVEEQFYLIWPFIIIAISLKQHKKSNDNFFQSQSNYLSMLLITSLIACIALSVFHPRLAYYMMPTRIWQFALGAIGYFWVTQEAMFYDSKKTSRILLTALIILTILTATLVSPTQIYPGYLALLPSLAAFCLLLIGDIDKNSLTSKMLSIKPLKLLGDLSYSLYLWHWPIWIISGLYISQNYLFHFTIAISFTFIFSALSFNFFESPIRHNNFLSKRSKITLAGALFTIILTVTISYFFQKIAHSNTNIPILKRFTDVKLTQPWIYAKNCDQWYYSAEVAPCMSGKMDAKHTAIIFGDSIGLQWITAIESLYENPEWRFIIYTKSACPIVDEKIFYSRIGREYVECAIWRTKSIHQIKTLKPDIIFIGSALQEFSQSQWIQGTQRILNELSPISKQIFILRSTPVLPYNGLDCLIRKKWAGQFINTKNMCEPKVDNTYNDKVSSWINDASKSFNNVSIIDMNNLICPNRICKLEQNNKVVYRDDKHLTAEFVEEFTPFMSSAIQSK